METYTNLKMTMENKAQAAEAAKIIAELASRRTPESPNELKNFLACIEVKRNKVIVDDSCSLHETTFLELIPEAIKACAHLTSKKFELIAWYYSCNCGYEASIEAERDAEMLNIKTIVSENGDGCCPECGEQVVCYDEYDPAETYYCPECGDELDHLEMFGGVLPVVTQESFRIA